jgi:hypothetical protein
MTHEWEESIKDFDFDLVCFTTDIFHKYKTSFSFSVECHDFPTYHWSLVCWTTDIFHKCQKSFSFPDDKHDFLTYQWSLV